MHRPRSRRPALRAATAAASVAAVLLLLLALTSWPRLDRLPSSSSSAAATASSLHMAAAPPPSTTVAVLGSGLAGLSAAYELSAALPSASARVVLLEKNPSLGGNSAKASSGINAVNAAAGDSMQAFAGDTTKSGGGHSAQELVATLAEHSTEGLQFLEGLGLNLSSIVRLGGHSFPRTHSNPTGPNVGFAIIKALSAKVQEAANVEVKTSTKVLHIGESSDSRLSIMYTAAQQQPPAGATAAATGAATGPQREMPPLPAVLIADAVVLASGGFAANKQMLQKYCPVAAELPTTNGPWATGDGVELGTSLGAELVGMQHVQVHPTGFVDPADPTAGTKWLAPEKLRGCGAILLNARGQRFVDELTTRDKVADAIMQQDGKRAWLLLGAAGGAMFGEATLGFYSSKHMVEKFDSLSAAAEHMGVEAAALQQQVQEYNNAAAAGGAGDAHGKQFFPTTIDAAGAVWVGQVTPVVHYTMGGLRINEKAQVLRADGSAIRGLFAAGEVSGGLHGANRLGGNSLAECVVFGRVAGQQAAQYVAAQALLEPGGRELSSSNNLAAAAQAEVVEQPKRLAAAM